MLDDDIVGADPAAAAASRAAFFREWEIDDADSPSRELAGHRGIEGGAIRMISAWTGMGVAEILPFYSGGLPRCDLPSRWRIQSPHQRRERKMELNMEILKNISTCISWACAP